MPTETLPAAAPAEAEASREVIDADSFCEAYQDVSSLIRHGLMVAQSRFNFDSSDLKKTDSVIYSDAMRSYIEQSVASGNYPAVLADEHLRSYIIDMACAGALGRLVELQLKKDRHSVSRLYKERMIEMNHGFAALADSELGQSLGIGRSHLRRLIASTYGLHPDSKEVSGLERGIAVEIGTKKCLEKLGGNHATHVRQATAAEDARNIDFVCSQGDKILTIQIKSTDTVGHQTGGLPQASYSRIEEFGPHEYRVRHLSPAADTAISEHFEVRAKRYEEKIDELLTEFDKLN